jgi:hypothetical protein
MARAKLVSVVICFAQLWSLCAGNYPPPPTASRYCVDVGNQDFTCSDDPIAVRKSIDKPKTEQAKTQHLSRGIAQRVDGTAAEQNAIKEVIWLMDRYFYEEVFAKPDYESVRNKW